MLQREMSLLLLEMVRIEEDLEEWIKSGPWSGRGFTSPLIDGAAWVVGLCVRDKEIKYGRGMLIYSSCVLLESIYATELCYLDGNGVVYRVL